MQKFTMYEACTTETVVLLWQCVHLTMYRNCTTGQSTGCVAGMDKVSVQVDDGIPSSEYSKWGQREVIQFLRMGQCKPAETQVDVCWAWCCMCIKGNGGCLAPYVLNRQPANHQHAKTSTSHIVGNPQNIAQGKMQLMRTFWTACSLSTKINTSVVSIVREFVQDLGSLKVCSQWIPHPLTHANKEICVSVSLEHLLQVMCFFGRMWHIMSCGVNILYL